MKRNASALHATTPPPTISYNAFIQAYRPAEMLNARYPVSESMIPFNDYGAHSRVQYQDRSTAVYAFSKRLKKHVVLVFFVPRVRPQIEGFKKPSEPVSSQDDFNAFKKHWEKMQWLYVVANSHIEIQRLIKTHTVVNQRDTMRFYVAVLSCPVLRQTMAPGSQTMNVNPTLFIKDNQYVDDKLRKDASAYMKELLTAMQEAGYAHGRLAECLAASNDRLFLMLPSSVVCDTSESHFESVRTNDTRDFETIELLQRQ